MNNSWIRYKYSTLYLSMEKQWINKMTDKDIKKKKIELRIICTFSLCSSFQRTVCRFPYQWCDERNGKCEKLSVSILLKWNWMSLVAMALPFFTSNRPLWFPLDVIHLHEPLNWIDCQVEDARRHSHQIGVPYLWLQHSKYR